MTKLIICTILSAFLFSCNNSNNGLSEADNPETSDNRETADNPETSDSSEVPQRNGDIHQVPNIDYNNIEGIIDAVSFEHRQVGEYTEDMFDDDFESNWINISGKAAIRDENGTNELAVTAPKGVYKKGIHSTVRLPEYNELYFSYQVRFDKNFDFKMGGKLPGLAAFVFPNDNKTPDGCNSNYKNAPVDSGFSLRSMFREGGRATGYFYHQDNPRNSGDGCGERIDYRHQGETLYFKREKTYLIEQYVKMNDPHTANGIVVIHVNGYKVLERTNMTFSESGLYGINYRFFYMWHGGNSSSWAPSVDSTAYFNHIVMSEEPVSYSKK